MAESCHYGVERRIFIKRGKSVLNRKVFISFIVIVNFHSLCAAGVCVWLVIFSSFSIVFLSLSLSFSFFFPFFFASFMRCSRKRANESFVRIWQKQRGGGAGGFNNVTHFVPLLRERERAKGWSGGDGGWGEGSKIIISFTLHYTSVGALRELCPVVNIYADTRASRGTRAILNNETPLFMEVVNIYEFFPPHTNSSVERRSRKRERERAFIKSFPSSHNSFTVWLHL
jgi:hypothetical protein